ncbi:MAG: hypothetical protein RLZZ419_1274 [Pseudomonadota bacterium]|jgi:F0F1-type ATP synthase membrane subunit b/b'
MQYKALLLITLLLASSAVIAEQDLVGTAGKAVLNDNATSAAPKAAIEGIESANQNLEDANKLKESVKNTPDALKDQAQDITTESAKKNLDTAVPEKAKQAIKTVDTGTKTAKKAKGTLPKSSNEATKALNAKAHKEATKKALDVLK